MASQDQPVSSLDPPRAGRWWCVLGPLPTPSQALQTLAHWGQDKAPLWRLLTHMSEVCEPAAPAHGGRASFCLPLFPQNQGGHQGEAAQGTFCGHGL